MYVRVKLTYAYMLKYIHFIYSIIMIAGNELDTVTQQKTAHHSKNSVRAVSLKCNIFRSKVIYDPTFVHSDNYIFIFVSFFCLLLNLKLKSYSVGRKELKKNLIYIF